MCWSWSLGKLSNSDWKLQATGNLEEEDVEGWLLKCPLEGEILKFSMRCEGCLAKSSCQRL